MNDVVSVKQRTSVTARGVLDTLTTIAVLIAALGVLWLKLGPSHKETRSKLAVPAEPISLSSTATKGSANAAVALVMFSDFECPFCKRFAETTLPRIEERYVDSGKVLIAFKHLPLGIHPLAERAARVAHCADKQRQFWKVHDLFFQHLDEQTLEHVPEALHLGENELDACTASPATTEVIRRDAALAARLSVTGTPAFFVGRVLPGNLVKVTQTIVGAANLQAFETAINSVLKQGS